MLAHTLAIAIALGSFSLYMAAFFFPEVHRKYDFLWSGVGFFYALVLWVCAGRITGGVLLGQTASVALLGWLGWQTLAMRRSLTPASQQTQLPGSAKTLGGYLQFKLAQFQESLQGQLDRPRSGNGFATVITRGLATVIALFQGLLNTAKPKPKKPTIIINRPPRSERVTPPVTPPTAVKPVTEPTNALVEEEPIIDGMVDTSAAREAQENLLSDAIAPSAPISPPVEETVTPFTEPEVAIPRVVKRSAPKPNPLAVLQNRIQAILGRVKQAPQPPKAKFEEAIAPIAGSAADTDLDDEFDELFSDLEEPVRETAVQEDFAFDQDFDDKGEPTVEIEVIAVTDPLTEEVIVQETIVIEEALTEDLTRLTEESLIEEIQEPIAIEEISSLESPIEERVDDEALPKSEGEERSPTEPPEAAVNVDEFGDEPEVIEATSSDLPDQTDLASERSEPLEENRSEIPSEVGLEETDVSQEAIENDHISVLGDGVAIEDTTEQQPS